ncbi:RNA ligase family protein [Spirillospora sp. CA-294931]|uniref:RNA ligase family protein n=1 Tax=Spirillospora sp. CA-294931 TaxID=3240042 RepID=UPI003D8A947D
MALEFRPWGKTPRLVKDMIITEKIDGTNGCVVIKNIAGKPFSGGLVVGTAGGLFQVGAQSRNRMLPVGPQGMDDLEWRRRDNQGFAQWVKANAAGLVETLGEGHHYGEWYGAKIARKYALSERRFALFNVSRWGHLNENPSVVPGLEAVPQLYQGPFDTAKAVEVYDELMATGSWAVPGYMNPEGVIVYHTASKQVYKYLGADDLHKWQLKAVA